MDWMGLAFQLTREAMKSASAEPAAPKPTELGAALTEQFQLIDRNIDFVARTVNAHNGRLEQALRRQRIWNVCLTVIALAALVLAIFK